MKKAVIAVALSVLVALLSANVNTVAHAQGELVAPSNVAAQNTANPGEVRISWDAVPDAAYYRIGWVAYADVEPIIASGGDWLEHFAFIDIENRGQTEHTITRLTPGVQYAFIMASNDGRYGTPRWPTATGWAFLTLNEAPATHASLGSTAVNLTWNAVPGAEYYRVGWVVYEDVAPIIASGGNWLEHFAFIDTTNRGQTEHTITRLTPGLLYAFIVAGNDGRYGTPQWPPATAWQFVTPEAGQPSTQQPGSGQSQAEQSPCPAPGWTVAPRPVSSVHGDYDADDDGLIELVNLAQLDAMRYDPSGRGSPSNADLVSYFGAFPNAVAGMGCPADGCTGFELVVDLDFDTNGNGNADPGDTYWNDGAGWLPIDDYNGRFDGGGHTIANLYINREFEYEFERARDGYGVGLFGGWYRGEISGVALTAVNVTGGSDDISVKVGGMFGYGRGTVSDTCVAGSVTANGRHAYAAGGLAGSVSTIFRPYGKISGSFSTATVSGGENVGGLVGSILNIPFQSVIDDSYATGAVSGQRYVGGLVGSGGNISASYATGTVKGRHSVGGLVGDASGSIDDSYATGDVSGGGYLGGLVGSGGNISASYATGAVTSTGSSVGGLVGSGGNISDSYATGAVTGGDVADNVGGLVGSGGNISDSYATGTVTGRKRIGGLVGSSGGSISGSYSTGAVSGSGISVGGLVGSLRGDLSRRDIVNISGSYATGVVSGESSYVGGLVGSSYEGSISGSYATGAVTGGGDYVGGLVGSTSSSISASYAMGAVSGANDVGGLVGRGRDDIQASYAMGAVSGVFRVGGLAGQARNTSNSYAVGRVSGSSLVGGLIGDNTGTVTDSYWDTVTSGQSHSGGGQGKTTSELQSPTGYTGIYANWNVDLDDADRDRNPVTGGDDPWDFGTSSQYPVLKYGGLDPEQQRR